MNVENTYGDDDRKCDKNHGKKEVFAEQGHCQWRRRNDLGQQEEEHSQRNQNGDAQRHLFARIRRQVKDEDG